MKLQKIIVVLGPPGSGKGTQSELLAKKLGYPKIVIGDLRREFIKGTTPEAQEDKQRYDKGIPAPDGIVSKLLVDTISKLQDTEGIVLDTFPLSMGQVQALEEIVNTFGVSNLKVIFLNVNEEEVVKRISQRKTCSKCKQVFLPGQKGYEENVCSNCGGQLVIRSDDKPEIAQERFEEYERRNIPIKEYYRGRGQLIEINGDQSIEDVQREIMEKL